MKQMGGCQILGKVEMRTEWLIGVGFPPRVMKIFWNEIQMMVEKCYECAEYHCFANFKMVKFML